jgi:hypothetical protein
MKLDNVKKLLADDFEEDDRELVDGIGLIINPFMTNVADLLNGQVDFANLKQEVVTFSVQVASDGTPTQALTLSTKKFKSIQGLVTIQVKSSSSTTSGLTSAPFVDFTLVGTGSIKVNKIFGLASGTKYQVTVMLIG